MRREETAQGDIFKKVLNVAQFLLLAVASWATAEIRTASQSVNELNVTIAKLLTEMGNQKDALNKLEERVHDIEIHNYGRKK